MFLSFFGWGAFAFAQNLDSLNPSMSGNCIKTLNMSDKLFENGDFNNSYKYWQRAYGICKKEIGSGMFYLGGEALLEYRLFEANNKEKKQVIDSLVELIETRQKYYGNEMQLKGQEPLTAHKKLIALQVFLWCKRALRILEVSKGSVFFGGFTTETFPTLLWDVHYLSLAVSATKENNQTSLTFVLDQEKKEFSVKQGSPIELYLENGSKVLLKANKKNASSSKIMKFGTFVYRGRISCSIDETSAAIIKKNDKGLTKISISTYQEKKW